MGEAKRRGSFEKRQAEGIAKRIEREEERRRQLAEERRQYQASERDRAEKRKQRGDERPKRRLVGGIGAIIAYELASNVMQIEAQRKRREMNE